jgi:transposase
VDQRTGPISCPGCQQRQQLLDNLRGRNAVLNRRILLLKKQYQREHAMRLGAEQRSRELEESTRTNASNSSLPPSANPIGAPKPTVKQPTGLKRGAQIGHVGHARKLIPSAEADERIEHRPATCVRCAAGLSGQPAMLIGRHQVAELPARAVKIIEHQSFTCRCGQCGAISQGRIPDAVRVSSSGQRLSAAIGLLSAHVQGSRRAVALAVQQMLGCPIALGTISAREQELSDALTEPYQHLVQHVSAAPVKYVDETTWPLKGQDFWLYVGASKDAAVFRIEKARNRPALRKLLGGKLRGTFCTDRAAIYDLLPPRRRGLCWAHLKRDFVRCLERGEASEPVGQAGLAISKDVFGLWRDFRERRITRRQMQERVEPLKERMHQMLEQGVAAGVKKTAGLCRSLLKREEALWQFAFVPGLEPTNNLAERMLRPAVVWRKKSFGSDSRSGCVFAQRMLSVMQTLKLGGRAVLDYLAAAVAAHRNGSTAPAILLEKPTATKKAPDAQPAESRKIA